MSTEYDVALSFAGEDRSIAREIAKSLKDGNISVFYDEQVGAELWGQNLFDYLEKVYTDSKLCIVLLSKSYSESQWTHNEFRNLLAHSLSRPSFSILPLHVGDAPIPKDLATVAYVELDSVSSQELVEMVKERLATLGPPTPEIRHENIHVIKRESGWAVKRGGASRATRVYKTRNEAITNARKLARRSEQAVVVVHNKDGSIESQERVSED